MALPRLTPNQREVFGRLENRSRVGRGPGASWKWVAFEEVGARTTLEHLVHKGYAERADERGPRGGTKTFYRPTGSPE